MSPKNARAGTALILLLFLCSLFGVPAAAEQQPAQRQPIQITYYYVSSCESCEDDEIYMASMEQQWEDVIDKDEYEIHMKDIYDDGVLEEFTERTKDMATDDFTPAPPLMVINDHYLFGIDDITEKARAVLVEEKDKWIDSAEKRVETFQNIPPDQSYFVYFYMPSCDSCEKVQAYLTHMDKSFVVEQGQTSKLQINYMNMGDLDNVPLAQWFFEKYEVPESRRKAPIVFYQNGYFQGYEEIVSGMPNALINGDAMHWENIDYRPASSGSFDWKDWLFLIFTGFVSGFSPCGISILLLLFSLLLTKQADVLKLGVTFILAKTLTFFLLGTVLYSVFEQIGAILAPVGKALQLLIAVLALVFAALNFFDYFMAKRSEYGKIRFQLPKRLRSFQQNYMQKAMNSGGKYLVGTVFITGIVVSVGEFLCTGQLYLASILYMMQRQTAWDLQVVLLFLLYLLAMDLPLLLLTILAKRGSQVLKLSELTRGKLPWIKLLYGLLFLVFAVLLFLFLL